MIAVYTAVAGGYDFILPHPDCPGVDFLAFADEPTEAPGWDLTVIPRERDEHPRLWAKRWKILGPQSLLQDYDVTVWMDSSHEILSPNFPQEAADCVGSSGIALHSHPWRQCIYSETEASVDLEKYRGIPIREQVDIYRQQGHPQDYGLWATGTIARRRTPLMDKAMDSWWWHNLTYTYQDQLSFPVVMREFGITPDVFPHHQVFDNPWLTIHPHASDL